MIPTIGPAVAWSVANTASGIVSGIDLFYVSASNGQICLKKYDSNYGWGYSSAVYGWTKAQPAVVSSPPDASYFLLFHTGTDGAIYYVDDDPEGLAEGPWAKVPT